MRKSTVLIGVLSLLCAISATVSWKRLNDERARVAALEQSLAALSAQSETPQLRTTAVISPPVVADKPSPENAAAIVSSVPEFDRNSQQRDIRQHLRALAQREKEMLRDSAYRTSVVNQHRRRFARTRAEVIRVTGMTEQQADGVIDVWVERDMRFGASGVAPGEPPTESMQAELKRGGESDAAKLRMLLGNEKYEQLNRYLASGQERAEINEFRTQLSAGAQPLNDNQVDMLVDTIYAERQRSSADYEKYVLAAGITNRFVVSANDRQNYLDLEHAANQRVHDAASASLSREQLVALDELLQARLAPSEAALRMQLDGKLATAN
ncbi:MAG: hypothetical protein ABI821_05800 [Pseudomonadota bacterium]